MRLINCKTKQLEFFDNSEAPPYATLSHTWDGDEVTFEDFHDVEKRQAKQGWQKIRATCRIAQDDGLGYAWVDSCCINKQSSAELSEAINSMFTWYGLSRECYSYLSDYERAGEQGSEQQITACRWFTRGWTLQELIAPSTIKFYDKNWAFVGTRADLSHQISKLTHINKEILTNTTFKYLRGILDSYTIATRMSWAASRTTRRPEDGAYSLLGIFGISTPMLYGEGGEKAFMRLQEEIIKDSNDMSIFAWKQAPSHTVIYHADTNTTSAQLRGILARSPLEFLNAQYNMNNQINIPEYAVTNKGLRMETKLESLDSGRFLMPLNCFSRSNGSPQLRSCLCIILQPQSDGTYVRAEPERLHEVAYDKPHYPIGQTIYISRRSLGARKWAAEYDSCTHFKFVLSNANYDYKLDVLDRGPPRQWDAVSNTFKVTSETTNFVCYERIAWNSRAGSSGEFIVIAGMEPKGDPWACVATPSSGPRIYKALEVDDIEQVTRLSKIQKTKVVLENREDSKIVPVSVSISKFQWLEGTEVQIDFSVRLSIPRHSRVRLI